MVFSACKVEPIMKQLLTITDLTTMGTQYVCIAGYLPDGTCVRPVLPPKPSLPRTSPLPVSYLSNNNQVAARPFGVVELDLRQPAENPPPHIEDWIFDPDYWRLQRWLIPGEQRTLLDRHLSPSVQAIFETQIDSNARIAPGKGVRSLGTIRPQGRLTFAIDVDKGGYRAIFRDRSNTEYDLKINDLTFRRYILWMQDQHTLSKGKVLDELANQLGRCAIYLRIGLTRPFDPTQKAHQGWCYLQVTGVYSFPDYLKGKCFADFKTI
jgi:hypothetical protein